MARIRFNHNTFATGMISKKLQGSTDFEKYNNSLDECVNFNIQHTGGCFKRGGSLFVIETYKKASSSGEIKTADYIKLVAFSYNYENSYICEFGIIRSFYSNGSDYSYVRLIHGKSGKVFNGNNDKDAIETKFSKIQIEDMTTYQYSNILYINIGDGIYKIVISDKGYIFSEEKIEYTVPPVTFHNKLPVCAKIIAYNEGGTEIVQTSSTTKTLKDISYYKIKLVDLKGNPLPAGQYTDILHEDDNPTPTELKEFVLNTIDSGFEDPNLCFRFVITSVDLAAKTINVKFSPEGSNSDIKYLFTSDKNSIADDTKLRLSAEIPLIRRWQISAFSKSRGYPKIMCPFEGRLFLANNDTYPLGVWASSILYQDFFNFTTGSGNADALQILPVIEKAESILWMIGQSKLFIGTISGLYIFNSLEHGNEAITPARCDVKLFQSTGVNKLNPIAAMDTIFFIDSSGMNVHELSLNENGFYEQYDLSLLSNELTASGIIAHTWQQNPIKTYWCATNEGHLCSLTYLRQNDILAWSKHVIGGKNSKVTSIASLFGEKSDQLYMVVNREVNGKRVNYIEYLMPMYDPLNQEKFKQYYVDSSIIKERKLTIKKIGNIDCNGIVRYDGSKSRNAHVKVGIISNIIENINLNLYHYVCFHNAYVNDDLFLDQRKTYRIDNITYEGFDIFNDLRYKYANSNNNQYTKIDPSEYPDYRFFQNENKFVFYKTNISINKIEVEDDEVVFYLNNNSLNTEDVILFHFIKPLENADESIDIDYADSKDNTFVVTNIDGDKVKIIYEDGTLLDASKLKYDKKAEVYIRYSSITDLDLGTNCYLSLDGKLDESVLNKIKTPYNQLIYIKDAFYLLNREDNKIYRSSDGILFKELNVSLPSVDDNNIIQLIDLSIGENYVIGYIAENRRVYKCSITESISSLDFTDADISLDNPNNNLFFIIGNKIAYTSFSSTSKINIIDAPIINTYITSKIIDILLLEDSRVCFFFSFSMLVVILDYSNEHYVTSNTRAFSFQTKVDSVSSMKIGTSNIYVAVGADGIFTSNNLLEDRSFDKTYNGTKYFKVLNNGKVFVAFNKENKDVLISSDGRIWKLLKNANLIVTSYAAYKNNMFVCANGKEMSYSKDGINWSMLSENDEVYINKVPGMDQLNEVRYKLHKKYPESDNKTQGVTLYDISKSPSVSNDDYAVLDTSKFSDFNYASNKTGNLYVYFDTIEGLDHLIGEKIQITRDGNKHSDNMELVPESGVVRLNNFCMYATAGLPFKAVLKTVPFSGGSLIGSSVGAVGSQKDISLHLYHSIGGTYGAEYDPNNNYPIKYKYDNEGVKSDTPVELFTGFLKLALPNSKSIYDRTIYIEHEDPTCFNVLAIAHDIWVSDS